MTRPRDTYEECEYQPSSNERWHWEYEQYCDEQAKLANRQAGESELERWIARYLVKR